MNDGKPYLFLQVYMIENRGLALLAQDWLCWHRAKFFMEYYNIAMAILLFLHILQYHILVPQNTVCIYYMFKLFFTTTDTQMTQ